MNGEIVVGVELGSLVEKIDRVSVQFINAVDDRVEIMVYLKDTNVNRVAIRVEQERLIELGIMSKFRNLGGVADRLESRKEVVAELLREYSKRL